MELRYPEGNFERYQLLDGSIGLSPPCSGAVIDLHVRITTAFQNTFQVSSAFPNIVHHLSGLNPHAWRLRLSKPLTRMRGNLLGPCYKTGEFTTGRLPISNSFPSNNFTGFSRPYSSDFSSFPQGTCALSRSWQYSDLDVHVPPTFRLHSQAILLLLTEGESIHEPQVGPASPSENGSLAG